VFSVPSSDTKKHYDLSIGKCDYQYVTWDLQPGDGVYGDFTVTYPSSGKAIQFFIADSATYQFWAKGNPISADVSITDTSGSFKYKIPNSDTWYFVFSNPVDWVDSRKVSFNLCLDQTPPDITTNLVAGMTYSGTEQISVTATDATFNIQSIILSIDSVQVTKTSTSPLSYSWYTSAYDKGTHTVRITASDDVGNTDYQELVVNVASAATTRSTSTGTTTTATSMQAGGLDITRFGSVLIICGIAVAIVLVLKRRFPLGGS
jgi:hypothetical protein